MKSKTASFSGKSMLHHILCIICILSCIQDDIKAQHIEIQGKAKVSVMDTANTENLLVVKKADGTLATRQVSTLPPDQPDTTRTLESDFELEKFLCTCPSLSKGMVHSLIDHGYTIRELMDFNVQASNLNSAGFSIVELLLSATPLELFMGGIPLDSLYGKAYQGGLIFYIDTQDTIPGIEGLVSASSNQNITEWGCSGTLISGADETAIGTGEENTVAIELGCSTSDIASEVCANLSLDGYDDWFLPSQDELRTMYYNLKVNGFGNFDPYPYWSSTQINITQAWGIQFGSGSNTGGDKSTNRRVRAVRAF
jgi:hypothetical protein